MCIPASGYFCRQHRPLEYFVDHGQTQFHLGNESNLANHLVYAMLLLRRSEKDNFGLMVIVFQGLLQRSFTQKSPKKLYMHNFNKTPYRILNYNQKATLKTEKYENIDNLHWAILWDYIKPLLKNLWQLYLNKTLETNQWFHHQQHST